MEEKLKLRYPVVVEGKYDKARVCEAVSSAVITLDGFGIFKNNEKKALLKRLCREKGIIILTDSDKAGALIRARLKDFLCGDIYNVYTPCVKGKERRKERASAEGLLGVEGFSAKTLRELLLPFAGEGGFEVSHISKAEFYRLGLSGGSDSAKKRASLAKELGLPAGLTANALLGAINTFVHEKEFYDVYKRCFDVG
ncbi:MAG: DUF4093 domain-containing protein [Clostridia bacterium]|nr:DUF4093 domain-containing protein [Clostridia bacterium]